MATYKACGGKLGTVANLTREAGKRGAKTNRAKAQLPTRAYYLGCVSGVRPG